VRADLKDPELEREADQDQVEVLEEELLVADEREEVEGSELRFHEVVAYIDALLSGRSTDLDEREGLTDLERTALGMIREAARGRALAEDRLVILNEALAVLQPVLAVGLESASAETHALYAQVVEEIAELKHSLESLSDAQEELFRDLEVIREGEAADAKPKPDAGEVGDERPSTLAGPGPAVEKPVVPSTLAGPGPAVEKPAAPSTLAGPGPAVEKPAAPSTLAGPGPAVEKPSPKSTVYEPES
jgi:hypothetical protein